MSMQNWATQLNDIKIKRDLKECYETTEELQELLVSEDYQDYGHLLIAYDITEKELKAYIAEILFGDQGDAPQAV